MIDALLRRLALSGPLEGVAVLLGVAYVLLILKRQRFGWVAGGVSSAIYVYLAASARLPMQSLLNAYYVAMAVYGWHSWSRAQQQGAARVTRWPLPYHAAAVVGIVLLSLISSHWLALETRAAWPLLDSLTAAISLLATWLVARMKLENWLYWIIADAITAFLFAAQGHPYTSVLFVIYLTIASVGFFEWLGLYRRQTP
ncbi:MAG TPA: nicotinamide riboside transporter PnuC [Steroidobacteraceae bacterium]